MEYLYLVPLILMVIICIFVILSRRQYYSVEGIRLLKRVSSLLVPKEGTLVFKKYKQLLRFTSFKVEAVFAAKIILFISVFCICVLIRLTNQHIYRQEVVSKFNYTTDVIYQSGTVIPEPDKALAQEIRYMKQLQKGLDKSLLESRRKEEMENLISGSIVEDPQQLYEPKAMMANKIYYRLVDYYQYGKWNWILYFLISLSVSFVLELFTLIYNLFAKQLAKKELHFLKKIVILNGSIKPVDFMEVLKGLIEKSRYHRGKLKLIEDLNKRNSVAKKDLYCKILRGTRDINEKLFYEKLEQANYYDFDQAILNIENDFKMEKRSKARKVRKSIEAIHAVGIIMFMVLVMILIIYLLTPWLNAYNTGAIY